MPRPPKSPLIRQVSNDSPKKKKSKIKSFLQTSGRYTADVAKFALQRAAIPYAVATLAGATAYAQSSRFGPDNFDYSGLIRSAPAAARYYGASGTNLIRSAPAYLNDAFYDRVFRARRYFATPVQRMAYYGYV